MCVICTAAPGTMPTIHQLAAMSQTNPDGAGIAWHDGTTLRRYRSADNEATLRYICTHLDDLTAAPVLMHFRLATNGPVCQANTHPFRWTKDGKTGYMAHNGISRTYSHGPHQCDSRNAIAAWEQGADLTDGREGKFATIDQTGETRWLTPAETIDGQGGPITVSNTNWQPRDPTTHRHYATYPEDAWLDGYQQGQEDQQAADNLTL